MASPMLLLPPELLLRISYHLTTPELGALRRTCKTVETALFNSFAKEFFSKRQFMIEHPSLQVLVDIAHHSTLSKQLREVIIDVNTLPDPNHEGIHVSPPIGVYYQSDVVPRDVLIHTGQARDMLVEAFSKLPNLRTVGLRDYDGAGRDRDGETSRWRSAGWSFGMPAGLTGHQRVHGSPQTLLALILYSIGLAHATPTNIEVFLRRRLKLTPASFVLHGYLGLKVKPVLAGLKTLMLTVGHDADTFDAADPPSGVLQAPLQRFLRHTPNLETLRLNFDQDDCLAHPFLQWFGKPANYTAQAVEDSNEHVAPLNLGMLNRLDIGMIKTDSETLIRVLTKFDLTSANLWKVVLQCKDSQELNGETGEWASFFNTFADRLPASSRIKRFSVGSISHCPEDMLLSRAPYSPHTHGIQAYFAPSEDATNRHLPQADFKVSYRAGYGSSVKQFLRDLAVRTFVPKMDPPSSSSGSSDDDDDDNGDDDGESEGVDDDVEVGDEDNGDGS